MSQARFDYFLTYARGDQAAARDLFDRLAGFGITLSCDFGEGGLRSGESWLAQLEERLLAADSYLILVGERAVDRWVQAELEVALNRNANSPGFRIVPILLPGISPAGLPAFLGRFEVILLAEDWRLPGSVSLARLIARLRPAERGPAVRPFPGLRAFDASMSAFFFGRSAELQQLLRLLGATPEGQRRWLQIEGASGSGKSSLAQAGLLPAAAGGLLPGAPAVLRPAVFRPGREPLRNLAQALFRVLPGGRDLRAIEELLAGEANGLAYLLREVLPAGEGLLLLADQLEELFSLAGGDPGPAGRLAAALAAALDDSDLPFYLVTTIRSDFAGELAKLPELVRHLNSGAARYLLPEIGAAGLAEAVRQPALLAGLAWENESLPERIVADAGLSPGSLPLVAHILAEMWERDHRGGTLTHATYDRLGGVGGALARSADSLLASFSERDQAVAKKLLLGLLQVQPGGAATRRVLGRAELLDAVGGEAAAGAVLGRLSGARDPRAPEDAPPPPRLVAVGADGHVELVHEALLRSWEKLRRWIDENRQALERRNDAENAARAWHAAGRPEEGLPRGKQLAYFRDAEVVGGLAREFLAAAAALAAREESRRREDQRFQRLAVRAALATVAAGLLVLAISFRQIYATVIEEVYLGTLDAVSTPTASELESAADAERYLAILGEPAVDAHRLDLAKIALARGTAHLAKDELAAAGPEFDRAHQLAAAMDPDDGRPFLIQALLGQGGVEIRRGALEPAVAKAEEAERQIDALPGEALRWVLVGPAIDYRRRLSDALVGASALPAALAQLERADELRQRWRASSIWRESVIQFAGLLAYSYSQAGQQAQLRGDGVLAFAALDRAIALNAERQPSLSPLAFARQQAQFYVILGNVAYERADFDRAREAYGQILELFADIDVVADANDRKQVLDALFGISTADFYLHRYGEAGASLDRAAKLLDRVKDLPPSARTPGELENRLQGIALRRSQLEESAGRIEQAWEQAAVACQRGEELLQLDPAAPGRRYQQLTCLERQARLADKQKRPDRLAATLASASVVLSGYPRPETLENDPQVDFLLQRLGRGPRGHRLRPADD